MKTAGVFWRGKKRHLLAFDFATYVATLGKLGKHINTENSEAQCKYNTDKSTDRKKNILFGKQDIILIILIFNESAIHK